MKIQFVLRTFAITLIVALLASGIQAQSLENDIKGLWSLEDGDNSFVNFSKDNDGLWQGIITVTDVDRSIGKILFTNGVYDEETNTIEGKLIHPDTGIRIPGTISLEDPKKLHVMAHKFWITKSFYWTR